MSIPRSVSEMFIVVVVVTAVVVVVVAVVGVPLTR